MNPKKLMMASEPKHEEVKLAINSNPEVQYPAREEASKLQSPARQTGQRQVQHNVVSKPAPDLSPVNETQPQDLVRFNTRTIKHENLGQLGVIRKLGAFGETFQPKLIFCWPEKFGDAPVTRPPRVVKIAWKKQDGNLQVIRFYFEEEEGYRQWPRRHEYKDAEFEEVNIGDDLTEINGNQKSVGICLIQFLSRTKPAVELFTRNKASYRPKLLEKIKLELGEVIVGFYLLIKDKNLVQPINQLGFIVWRPLPQEPEQKMINLSEDQEMLDPQDRVQFSHSEGSEQIINEVIDQPNEQAKPPEWQKYAQLELTSIHMQHINALVQEQINLPLSYDNLYVLFASVDATLNRIRGRNKSQSWTSFNELQSSMTKAALDFTILQFQQMVQVVPEFFLHRWDITLDKTELFVGIPANITEICARLALNYSLKVSNEPLVGTFNTETQAQRQAMFNKQLVILTYKAYIAYQLDHGKNMAFDFEDWPSEFYEVIDYLPEIPPADLKLISSVEAVSQQLQKFEIRNQMEQKESLVPISPYFDKVDSVKPELEEQKQMHQATGMRERSAFEPPEFSDEYPSFAPEEFEANNPVDNIAKAQQPEQLHANQNDVLMSSEEPSEAQKLLKPNQVPNYKVLDIGVIRRLDAFGLSMPNEKYFQWPPTVSHEPVHEPYRLEKIEWRPSHDYNLKYVRADFNGKYELEEFGNKDVCLAYQLNNIDIRDVSSIQGTAKTRQVELIQFKHKESRSQEIFTQCTGRDSPRELIEQQLGPHDRIVGIHGMANKQYISSLGFFVWSPIIEQPDPICQSIPQNFARQGCIKRLALVVHEGTENKVASFSQHRFDESKLDQIVTCPSRVVAIGWDQSYNQVQNIQAVFGLQNSHANENLIAIPENIRSITAFNEHERDYVSGLQLDANAHTSIIGQKVGSQAKTELVEGDVVVGIYGALDRKEGRNQNSICSLGFYVWRPQPNPMEKGHEESKDGVPADFTVIREEEQKVHKHIKMSAKEDNQKTRMTSENDQKPLQFLNIKQVKDEKQEEFQQLGVIRRLEAFGQNFQNDQYFTWPGSTSEKPQKQLPKLQMIEWKRTEYNDLGVIRVHFQDEQNYREFGVKDLATEEKFNQTVIPDSVVSIQGTENLLKIVELIQFKDMTEGLTDIFTQRKGRDLPRNLTTHQLDQGEILVGVHGTFRKNLISSLGFFVWTPYTKPQIAQSIPDCKGRLGYVLRIDMLTNSKVGGSRPKRYDFDQFASFLKDGQLCPCPAPVEKVGWDLSYKMLQNVQAVFKGTEPAFKNQNLTDLPEEVTSIQYNLLKSSNENEQHVSSIAFIQDNDKFQRRAWIGQGSDDANAEIPLKKGDVFVGMYGSLDRKEGRNQNSICALGFYVWRPQPDQEQ